MSESVPTSKVHSTAKKGKRENALLSPKVSNWALVF